MTMQRIFKVWLSLLVVLVAVPFAAQAQMIPFDLEVGYRWLSVSGDADMYRSQINERSGFLIRSFSLNTTDFNGKTSAFDHFRIDVSDLGAGPAGSLRLEAGKNNAYRFRMNYRMTDAYSALPAFANPFLAQGVIPGQHTLSRTRKLVDADLEFLPFHSITPFVGYTWNHNEGPSTTTYFLGQDEFKLLDHLTETDQEMRGGFSFRTSSIYGQLTQGWRRYSGTDTLTLDESGTGNNLDPVLGQPVTMKSLTRLDRTDVQTPFTNIYVTAQPGTRVRLIGNYNRSTSRSIGAENEDTSGSFVSFPLSRFFTGLSDQASSRAYNKMWHGGARAEFNLAKGVDLVTGYQRDHRNLDGSALINTLYLQSITFGGLDPQNLKTVLNATNALEREQIVSDVAISARSIGPFFFRTGYTIAKQNVTVTPDLSEIVVNSPNGQGGEFERKVDTFDVGAGFTARGFTLAGSFKEDHADNPIFRTDFLSRQRYRLRASWAAPKLVRLGVSTERTGQRNDQTDIGLEGRIRQSTADVELTPSAIFTLRGSYSQFRADSSISYRIPQNFNVGESVHTEKGNATEGGFSVLLKPFSFDASVGRFENVGTSPFTINRYRIRAVYDFQEKTGLAAEVARDRYSEPFPSYGSYLARRYGLFIRYRP